MVRHAELNQKTSGTSLDNGCECMPEIKEEGVRCGDTILGMC